MTNKISDPAYYHIKDLLKKRILIRRKMDALNREFDYVSGIIARLAPSGSDVLSDNIDDFCFYRSVNIDSLENPND